MPPNDTAYNVPSDPADPQAAACELMVRMPEAVMGDGSAGEVLRELAALLGTEDAFAGMAWRDARHAAVAIVFDVLEREDTAASLRLRAGRALDGTDNMGWTDPAAMARALSIAADLLIVNG